MPLDLRRKPHQHGPYRAVLWSLVAICATLYYFQRSPWHVPHDDAAAEPIEIVREAKADVVLVLDYAAIRQSPASFEQKDWSAAWLNLLEQEIGPVTVATPRSLSHRVLEDSRVVILTASVTQSMTATMLNQLREHAAQGNVLLIERPTGALREAFSADGRANTRRGREITFVKDMPEPYVSQLRASPLSTDYIGSTTPLPEATTLLAIDGAPVIYAKPVGKGYAITVDFDLGEQLVAMQQGKPSADFKVKPKDREREHPEPGDLLMDEQLRGASTPYADMLERFIVHGVLSRYAPLPVLWPYPQGARGLVISVHEDDALGDGGGWMLEHESERQATSTLLTTTSSGLTAAGAATIHRMGGDIGLLWRMDGTPEGEVERLGLGGYTPLARPVSLAKQLGALKETLPVNYVRTSSIAGHRWSPQWASPLKHLAKQGIRVDLTYRLPRTSGYAFGTGLPFLALDEDGLPLGIREQPIVVPNAPVEGPNLQTLLELSQRGHHMAIATSISPAAFADYPHMEEFERWLKTFEAIQATGHKMTSAYRFDEFSRSRRASHLRSRLVYGARIPKTKGLAQAEGNLDKKGASSGELDKGADAGSAEARGAILLRITVESRTRGMWLAIPERLGEHTFATARQRVDRVGAELVSAELTTDTLDLVGYPLRRLALERGFNTIDVYYRP